MNNAKYYIIKSLPILLAGCLFATTHPIHAEPLNLDNYKEELNTYYNSGKYNTDIQTVAAKANQYLAERIANNLKLQQHKKLAIVLAIDETSLSNYAHLRQQNFATPAAWHEVLTQSNDPAIQPTLSLYRYALAHGVAVFFVTARQEKDRLQTVKNLTNAGFSDWDGLMLKPNSYNLPSAVPYKVAMRKKIISMGYDIVLNLGDQESDLEGSYADKTFKLPNPYYLIG